MKTILNISFITLATLLVSACGGAQVKHPSPFAELLESGDMTTAPYMIGVGDEVEVKFFFTPELNDKMQVRPDGNISLMFAQDIPAAGKTPKELAALIRKKLKGHIKHPDLVVVVRTFTSQRVFIAGEVAKPGPYTLPGRETLLQALDEAGWVTPMADGDVVVLMRRNAKGVECVYVIRTDKIIHAEDMAQNITVHPGDFILVPPSGAVTSDRWIDQHIRQMLPMPGNFVINRGVGPQ